MKRTKTAWDRMIQRNRLFAKLMGPGCHMTSDRNRARIFRVLFK